MRSLRFALGAAAAIAAGVVLAQSGPEVVKAKGCTTCHAVDQKKVGPAFKDVAAKYKGDGAAAGNLAAKLKEAKDAYWTTQVEIQAKAASAWIAFAEGQKDQGIALMREAAAMEDLTEKSAISPGPIKPAHELLGEMLLEAGKPAEALAEFETTTKKEPNRFRGVYGAAVAAEKSNNSAKAKEYYKQLLQICEKGDQGARPELEAARKAATD